MRDGGGIDVLRRIDPGEVHRARSVKRHGREAPVAGAPAGEDRPAGVIPLRAAALLHVLPDRVQALRLRQVEGAQQHTIDSAEDGRVEPDAEAQGEKCCNAENRSVPQGTKDLPKIDGEEAYRKVDA